MIPNNVYKICCEDISLIENYNKALSDTTQIWCCHHRLETDKNLSAKELISMNMYYDRPASELIFLSRKEHAKLHMNVHHPLLGIPRTEETKTKVSKGLKEYFKTHNVWNKGVPATDESKRKNSESHIGKTAWNKGTSTKEETRKKQSKSHIGKLKGSRWMTNGIKNVRIYDSDIEKYIELGYQLGKCKPKK